jgi:glyoxylate/succinic semialdehyde reductase
MLYYVWPFATGDQALFDAVAHPLGVMGKASFFLGEVGAGANMKLVVNMIMGSMMVAFAEGLTLAEKVRGLTCCCYSWMHCNL